MDWTAILWLFAALIPLVYIERWIHRHLQGTALLLVGDQDLAVWLYALPLLPGIALHELSHAAMGWWLGAEVGRISIVPARSENRIQLGFVPMEKLSTPRMALVGLAPLIAGCTALLLIGHLGLHLGPAGAALAAGDLPLVLDRLREATQAPNFWVWAYLAFSISNTMFPSRSDLRAWPVIALFLLIVVSALALLGASALAPVASTLRWLAIACGLTALIDLPFALLIMAAEAILRQVKGARVEYR